MTKTQAKKRVAKQLQNGGQQRNRQARLRSRPAGRAPDPFVECFLSSAGAKTGAFSGIPDRYSGNTVIVEHQAMYVIRPDSTGRIAFAIVPCALGGLAIRAGKTDAKLWNTDTSTWQTVTVDTDSAAWTASPGLFNHYIIPFPEYTRGNPDTPSGGSSGQNVTTFYSDSWRCAASKASLIFQGDDFHNAGMVHAGRQQIRMLDTTFSFPAIADVVSTEAVQVSDNGPQSISGIVTLPDYKMGRVSKPVQFNNVHIGDFGMQQYREGFIPTDLGGDTMPTTRASFPFAQLGKRSAGPDGGHYTMHSVPGFSEMTTTFVQIDGMASEREGEVPPSVAVLVKNCVEYSIAASSSVARFTKRSPNENPQALKAVIDAGKDLPSMISGEEAEHCGWWCKAKTVGGYAARGASMVADFIPYVGPTARGLGAAYRGVGALTNAFQSLGGGNALAGVSRYAIGY